VHLEEVTGKTLDVQTSSTDEDDNNQDDGQETDESQQ
jgi:hypothetical protein